MKKLSWRQAATISAGFTAWVAGSHYYARVWTATESYAAAKYEAVYERVATQMATSIGYERPQPVLTILDAKDMVTNEALRQGVNPSLVRALLTEESHQNPSAVSSVGAIGLMQVMPANARRCGLQPAELFHAKKNIACGVKIYREDLMATDWNPVAATERYNGGPKCVGNKCQESIKHARKVLRTMSKDTDEKPVPEYYTVNDKEQLNILIEQVAG